MKKSHYLTRQGNYETLSMPGLDLLGIDAPPSTPTSNGITRAVFAVWARCPRHTRGLAT